MGRTATYSTMTLVRAEIVGVSGESLARAATIATRYAAVRAQGYADEGHETRVLDYAMQQVPSPPSSPRPLRLCPGSSASLHLA